jgi:thioredoxin 1
LSKLKKFLLAVLVLVSSPAFSVGNPITKQELTDIEKNSKSAVITVHADWCPTCKSQDKILINFMKDPVYKNVTFYQLDFDTQKDLLKTLKVSAQSTIIVFKSGKEVARTTGDTKEEALSRLTKQAI